MLVNDYEKLFLGFALQSQNGTRENIKNLARNLDSKFFDGRANPVIFTAIRACLENDGTPSPANIALMLKGNLDKCGGLEYLESLVRFPALIGTQVPDGIEEWAEIIAINGQARLLYNTIQNRLGSSLEEFQQKILEADDPKAKLSEVLTDLDSKFLEPIGRKPIGSIGIEELDNFPDPEWVVENVLSTGGMCVLAGDGGCGKTWLSLALALSVASGKDYLGHFKVKRGPVVYIDQENDGSLIKRRRNLLITGMGLKYEDLEPIRFIGIDDKEPVDFYPLFDRNTHETYRREIVDRLVAELKIWNPVLVIVDSLRASHSGREDYSDDMRPVMDTVRKAVKEANGTAGAFIDHHMNKGGSTRGSGDIKNAATCLIEAVKKDETIILEYKKLREAVTPKPFEVELYSDGIEVALSYSGENEKMSDKKENNDSLIKHWVLTTLEEGKRSRQHLIESAESNGFCKSRKMINILDSLLKDEKITKAGKEGRNQMYSFVREQESEF